MDAYDGDAVIKRRTSFLADLFAVRRSFCDWIQLPPVKSRPILSPTQPNWWNHDEPAPDVYPSILNELLDETKQQLLWGSCLEELRLHSSQHDPFSQPELPFHFLWYRLARLFFTHVEPRLLVSLEWDPHRRDGTVAGMTEFPNERPVDFVVRWNDADRPWPLLFCEVSPYAVAADQDHKDFAKMTYQMAYSLSLQLGTYTDFFPSCFGLFIGGLGAEPVALDSHEFDGATISIFTESESLDISLGPATIAARLAHLFAYFGQVVTYARNVEQTSLQRTRGPPPKYPNIEQAPQSRNTHGSNTPAKKEMKRDNGTAAGNPSAGVTSTSLLARSIAVAFSLDIQSNVFEVR